MIRDPIDLAPFPDADAALRFAYRHRHGDYPASTLGRSTKRPTEEPALPSGLDAAALVLKGRWTTQDPPLYAGQLTPIQAVDFYPQDIRNGPWAS